MLSKLINKRKKITIAFRIILIIFDGNFVKNAIIWFFNFSLVPSFVVDFFDRFFLERNVCTNKGSF